jgi:hypothetical protein
MNHKFNSEVDIMVHTGIGRQLAALSEQQLAKPLAIQGRGQRKNETENSVDDLH